MTVPEYSEIANGTSIPLDKGDQKLLDYGVLINNMNDAMYRVR